MTPFDQALQAANALPAEDLILLMRALLDRFEVGEWARWVEACLGQEPA